MSILTQFASIKPTLPRKRVKKREEERNMNEKISIVQLYLGRREREKETKIISKSMYN